MGAEPVCLKCGHPLGGKLTCTNCGAVAGGDPGVPAFKLPELTMPLPGVPTFGGGLSGRDLGTLLDVGKLELGGKLDFTAGAARSGRPYQPLFAIGQPGEGKATLRMPFGLAPLPDGGFWLIHFYDAGGRAQLLRFTAAGEPAGSAGPFETGAGDHALDAPAGVVADREGACWIVDMGASRLKRFSPDGRCLAVLGGPGTADQQLDHPQGIAIAPNGDLIVADSGNNRVLRWDPQGRCLLVLGINRPDPDLGGLQAGEEPGELDAPKGACADALGNIYVADTNNHRIQKFGHDGSVALVFGEEGADAGQLYYPRVVRVDAAGDIFVADSKHGRVQKFNADGQFVYQVVMPADAGLVEDFAVDDAGRLLVALRSANLVLKFEVR
ncbi:MAG TPA: NHL repeat-containing protein [Acidobacteriota bacterium]|nr:NHL repeat-containing protein [Acidobacteriota bacterium]HQG92377.1 NHL repeat-containing protein [Acidobacteriota bacterium]HQK88159.1 NHL repeat-containing protein [Acidobacteriota bacterium]